MGENTSYHHTAGSRRRVIAIETLLKKSGRTALVCLLAALFILPACTNESPTECTLYQVGAVEGYVLSSGEGVSVLVQAESIVDLRRYRLIAETFSDSTGWYRFELPVGLYQLLPDPYRARPSSTDLRDTVRVAPRVQRHDLLRGRVEIDIGMPVECEGQSVNLRLMLDERTPYAGASGGVANGRAHIVIPAVLPGVYKMEARYGDSEAYLPGSLDFYDADTIQVDRQSTARYEGDFAESYARIDGRITGSWSLLPSPWARVAALSNWREVISDDLCGQDGSFRLVFLIPQRVRLGLERSSWEQTYNWFGGASFETATVFDLQPGDRLRDVTLSISSLRVLLDGPGNRIEHRGELAVRDETGSTVELDLTSNPILIWNLRAGRYWIEAVCGCSSGQNWVPQWYEGADDLESATPVDLAEGELREITFHLTEGGGRISGTVLAPDGTPAEGVYCYLVEADGYSCSPHPLSSPFEFKHLLDGEYLLAAVTHPDSDDLWWYPGTSNRSNAVRISILEHGTVSGLTWSLPSQ